MPKVANRKISDESVKKRTGKDWHSWFALLDSHQAFTFPHKQIAELIYQKFGVDDWWGQMIAVTYEQHKGLRQKNQKADGFSVTVSKTISAPLEELFLAWSDSRLRKKWLEHPEFTVRKETPSKSMRITWIDSTNLDVNFYSKGPTKSQVAVEHSKLASSREVAKKKAYWGIQLLKLSHGLEGSSRARAR